MPVLQQQVISLEKTNNNLMLSKNKLHCVDCFVEAELWCPQCMKAFCQKCWNRASHHTIFNKRPITSIDKNDFKVRSMHSPIKKDLKESQSLPSTAFSPTNKSYSKSILFASYKSDEDLKNLFHPSEEMIDPRLGSQMKPALVPRDETITVEYQDYPNNPVFIDGRGNIHEIPPVQQRNIARNNPFHASSSPERPISPFHPQSDQKIIIRTLSPPIMYDTKLGGKNASASRFYDRDFQGNVTSAIHYVSASQYSQQIADLTQSAAHQTTTNATNKNNNNNKSKNEKKLQEMIELEQKEKEKEIKVRRDPYKHRKKPKTAFTVSGSGGGLSIAFGGKAAANMVPMKGITHELLPIDWKDGLYRVKELPGHHQHHGQEEEKKRSVSPSGRGTATATAEKNKKNGHNHHHHQDDGLPPKGPELFDVKPREISVFNGVPIYTVNYKK
jgi:hypothetical protein